MITFKWPKNPYIMPVSCDLNDADYTANCKAIAPISESRKDSVCYYMIFIIAL